MENASFALAVACTAESRDLAREHGALERLHPLMGIDRAPAVRRHAFAALAALCIDAKCRAAALELIGLTDKLIAALHGDESDGAVGRDGAAADRARVRESGARAIAALASRGFEDDVVEDGGEASRHARAVLRRGGAVELLVRCLRCADIALVRCACAATRAMCGSRAAARRSATTAASTHWRRCCGARRWRHPRRGRRGVAHPRARGRRPHAVVARARVGSRHAPRGGDCAGGGACALCAELAADVARGGGAGGASPPSSFPRTTVAPRPARRTGRSAPS